MKNQPAPIFEMPSAPSKRKGDDSVTLQGVYQRYWEAKEFEKRNQARRRRSRGPYADEYRKYYGDASDE
ncbi:MAG TPA: hypothetical protein VF131_22975 [Blastocatellia bacterium]|nr:hypothetical protein [Blastocatellia bacterium]